MRIYGPELFNLFPVSQIRFGGKPKEFDRKLTELKVNIFLIPSS